MLPQIKRIDVTLVLATRGRLKELKRLLESIKQTTENKSAIEVILGVDYCDNNLSDIINLSTLYPFDILVVIQKRSRNISHDYINRLFGMARGEWLWVMNDDVEVLTEGWDRILHSIPRTGRPVCVDTLDNTRNFNGNGQFACFPMMNKHAFKALGYFFSPYIPTWGADKWLSRVCADAGIIEALHDIKVHHHMNLDDDQHKNMRDQMRTHGSGDGFDFTDDVARLVRYRC